MRYYMSLEPKEAIKLQIADDGSYFINIPTEIVRSMNFSVGDTLVVGKSVNATADPGTPNWKLVIERLNNETNK
jgi:hypothetical protein